MTVSGVMSFICFWGLEFCEGDTCPALLCLDEQVLVSFSRGRVFLNMLTIRRLMGNMMTELWMPIITCCHVNSMWPREKILFELRSSKGLLVRLMSSAQELNWMSLENLIVLDFTVTILEQYSDCFYTAFCLSYPPRSMVCSEGSVGMPQNIMLVNMVQSNREKQQDTRCTRVKVLQGGRLMTENQMWPSLKSLAVFIKNRLL